MSPPTDASPYPTIASPVVNNGRSIAYRYTPGRAPVVVFLPGFRSHMGGLKARYFEQHCRFLGQAYLRLDYSGHGHSQGRFEDGVISDWASDARAVIEHVWRDEIVLVGSSMGGWIMLLLALQLDRPVTGLLGIAAAPDFVDDLVDRRLTGEQARTLETEGAVDIPSRYDPVPTRITRALIEDGRNQRVLHRLGEIRCPVRLVHGLCDEDVPWERSLAIMNGIGAASATLTLVKGGDHRLSKPVELSLLATTLQDLVRKARPLPDLGESA